MSKVIAFNRETSFVNKKKAPTNKPTPRQPQPQQPTNESYFIRFQEVEFSFGGAFIRDFILRINNQPNKERLHQAIESTFSTYLEKLKATPNMSQEIIDLLSYQTQASKEHVIKGVDALKTPQDLDSIFDSKSLVLAAMPTIITLTLHTLYTEFELIRMHKQNWFHIDTALQDFLTLLDETYGN